MEPRRRTQRDRSDATRSALIDAARPLFAAQGFASVGTEEIVRAAGVTRGALYHQFRDKAELFAAVCEAVEADVARRLGEQLASAGATDPLEAMRLGSEAWLDLCAEPEVEQIVLLDGPAVLGWRRWRDIGMRHGLGLVEGVLAHAMERGRIALQPTSPLAHVLIGALDEAALYVARAEDREAARDQMRGAIATLIAGLAAR